MLDSTTKTVNVGLEADLDWWRGAVIYQIYPRSFQDSNGDGIGDLAGIVERLPYVASLGVDAIWISPFFPSPMKDFGYDVTDYCDIDPMFGNLDEMQRLLDRARELGLKIMIDLVLSHTSDQHPWFIESRQDRTNAKSDWYVWADPKPDGTPPNNWLSIFGGPAWQWDARREQYYMHNFLTSQPDLNFHNSQMQDTLLECARFWLDRGVSGFRLDTINFYACDKELRDNPPLPEEERNSTIAPRVNPYNHQRHLYSKNRPETVDFLRRFRSLLNEYPGTVALGEVGDAQRGLEILGEYTSNDDKVQMCYAFEFLSAAPLTPDLFIDVFKQIDDVAADGWACWAWSNHDVMRHSSRWTLSDQALKSMATLGACLRGSLCLFQGEELGLREANVPYEALQDPYGKEFWPQYKGRDGCRTPMVWTSQAEQGGFTTGTPWLPVSDDHLTRSVATLEDDSASILAHYRRAIGFRRDHPAIQKGDLVEMTATGSVLHFIRRTPDQVIFCAFNLSDTPGQVSLPRGEWRSCGLDLGAVAPNASGEITLGAWEISLALSSNKHAHAHTDQSREETDV